MEADLSPSFKKQLAPGANIQIRINHTLKQVNPLSHTPDFQKIENDNENHQSIKMDALDEICNKNSKKDDNDVETILKGKKMSKTNSDISLLRKDSINKKSFLNNEK